MLLFSKEGGNALHLCVILYVYTYKHTNAYMHRQKICTICTYVYMYTHTREKYPSNFMVFSFNVHYCWWDILCHLLLNLRPLNQKHTSLCFRKHTWWTMKDISSLQTSVISQSTSVFSPLQNTDFYFHHKSLGSLRDLESPFLYSEIM